MKTTALLKESDQKFLNKYNKTTKSLDLWVTDFDLWVLYDKYAAVVPLPEDWEGGILAPQNALIDPELVHLNSQKVLFLDPINCDRIQELITCQRNKFLFGDHIFKISVSNVLDCDPREPVW